jgi:outer membrane protein OmpA-like peptidoglycan-associated protein
LQRVVDVAELHFANDRANLTPEGQDLVHRLAVELKVYRGPYSVLIVGHTSLVGTRAHNLVLSRRRAQTVAQYLIAQGIPAERIQTQGLGPDQPIADNRTRAGAARNRRVELHVHAPGLTLRKVEGPLVDPAKQAHKPHRKRKLLPKKG